MTDSGVTVSWPSGPLGVLLLGLAFAVLTGLMEGIARAVAPPPERDPRLGYVAFWLTVAVVALATPVLAVAIERTGALFERVLCGLWVLAWLAWKAGITDHPDDPPDSQRDHEQIWAFTVGMAIGFAVIPRGWLTP